MKEQPKVILSLSGGMDSATLLSHYINAGYDVLPVTFIYGSNHNIYERASARKLAKHYNLSGKHIEIDVNNVFKETKSNLLGGVVPEGHYNDASMKQTVVPGRNLVFASILAGIAESKEYEAIALAVHSGDHHIYPDCRPEFINLLFKIINSQSEGKVFVFTPFLHQTKTNIISIGKLLNTPYFLTRTCYKNQSKSCGKCGSCSERLEAFKANGLIDPIEYE